MSQTYTLDVGWIGTNLTACRFHEHAWSDEMYCSACRGTQAFDLAVMQKNLFSILVWDPELHSIGLTTTTCQLHVHAMSVVMYLEARCDTQTFERAMMGKNCPVEQILYSG